MDDATRAPEHDAPPPWRPLSAGAVTALVLSLAFGVLALLGPWWLEILPLVVGAASWRAIADGRRRGRGVALTACVIALLAGTASLVSLGHVRSEFESRFDALLQALSSDDRKELMGWVLQGEDGPATVAQWRERMQAAEREVGPYARRTVVDWGLMGPYAALVLPPAGDLEEVGAPAETRKPPMGSVWFQARFAHGALWAALELGREDAPLDLKQVLDSPSGDRLPFVRRVRFFRSKARS